MQLPNTLTDAQSVALVAAIRVLAGHGREIRLAREARERAEQESAIHAASTNEDEPKEAVDVERIDE